MPKLLLLLLPCLLGALLGLASSLYHEHSTSSSSFLRLLLGSNDANGKECVPYNFSANGKECVPYNFSANSETVDFWGWQGWFVLADLFALFLILFYELVPIEFAMVCAVLVLRGANIITTGEMTAGFANAGILAIVCLFIVAEGLTATGAIDYFMGKLLGQPKTLGQALVRMMVPCSFIAAWISSTAVVALMIPIVQRWAKRINQPPSLLMMPMCYAVHLGGTVTLVGTTTNLVVSGLYSEYFCKTMGIFELSRVGLPVAIAGVGCLLLLAPRVLPDAEEYARRTMQYADGGDGVESSARAETAISNYTFDAIVPASMDGLSIEDAALRNLRGLFLTTARRGNKTFHAVGPEFILHRGDRISFAGAGDEFLALCDARGLTYVTEDETGGAWKRAAAATTTEAVVSASSYLVGKTMKEVNFRTRYNAAALAIHRAGEKISKLGQVVLQVGDVLLLLTGHGFSWDAPETRHDLKPRKRFHPSRACAHTNSSTATGFAQEATPEYIFSMRVSPNRRLAGVRVLSGLSLDEAGVRNIPGVRIVAVTRGEHTESELNSEYVLEAGDVLWFSGAREGLSSLRRVPGLEDLEEEQVKLLGVPAQSRRLIEVVVSLKSDLLYKTVRESKFRTRFQAAIVAIQRRDKRVLARIGDTELEPGDVLILDAGPDFTKRFARDANFLVMSEVEQSAPPRMDRFYIAATAALGMIVLTASTGEDLLLFALLAAGIILTAGVLTRERAHKAVDWTIIITIAAAFGLSTAMRKSNVATVLGNAITNLALNTGTGELGVMLIIMIATELLCALITAKAGALMMFPIAMNAAHRLEIAPITMCIALMLGASDYTTPQGHQTNMMVLSPGAYRFVDYQKLGIPLEVYLNVMQLLCLALVEYWYLTTLGAILVLLICIGIDHALPQTARGAVEAAGEEESTGDNREPLLGRGGVGVEA